MGRRKHTKNNFSLNLSSVGKRGRGRPASVDAAIVRNSADKYRIWLERSWNELGASLLTVETEQEIIDALQRALPGYDELPPLAPLILKVLREPNFPRKRKKAQIGFLADSIGGRGKVTPRRSRDICAEERIADAQRHRIIRYEYWIECSCGYKGRSENHLCRRCGAVLYVPDIVSEYA